MGRMATRQLSAQSDEGARSQASIGWVGLFFVAAKGDRGAGHRHPQGIRMRSRFVPVYSDSTSMVVIPAQVSKDARSFGKLRTSSRTPGD